MSHPNTDRDERVAEIRTRQVMRGNVNDKWYVEDIDYLLSLLDSQAGNASMNKLVLGSDVTDAAPNVSCPKCGGTKPTCCSCPEETGALDVPAAISVIEQMYNEWWDNDRRRCLDKILARLKAVATKHEGNTAATRMRARCIETVKEYWQRIVGEDDEGMRELLFGALVVKLENLTLEGQEKR